MLYVLCTPPLSLFLPRLCLRLRNLEQQMERSTREYNMEKLAALRTEVDESTRKFEECQDAYATSMYEFISKEQQYTDKIQLVCVSVTTVKVVFDCLFSW